MNRRLTASLQLHHNRIPEVHTDPVLRTAEAPVQVPGKLTLLRHEAVVAVPVHLAAAIHQAVLRSAAVLRRQDPQVVVQVEVHPEVAAAAVDAGK